MTTKYYFKCRECETVINGFSEWFNVGQECPKCGNKWVDAHYNSNYTKLKELLSSEQIVDNLWHYFDFLPVNDRSNIISMGEKSSPVYPWTFLDEYAQKKYNINCNVYAYINNFNNATRTFKDIAGTLAASILKEAGVKEYVVASTGNTANAFAHYFAAAGISLSVFMPEDALLSNAAEVSSYGQKVFRVKGDYAYAKKVASDYAKKHNILMTIGNIDPIRVEAKKIWVFEWLRLMKKFPTVYIQAVSGGTGPIAVDKAIREIQSLNLIDKSPKYISVQPSKCSPMVEAWITAKKSGFQNNWEKQYPIYEKPQTAVPTLATGNPTTYPIIAKLTKQSEGEIIEFDEILMAEISKLITYETTLRIGPASAISVGGFFQAMKQGLIKNNDVVLLNLGEGVERAPDYVRNLAYTITDVSSADECYRFDRSLLKNELWKKFYEY